MLLPGWKPRGVITATTCYSVVENRRTKQKIIFCDYFNENVYKQNLAI